MLLSFSFKVSKWILNLCLFLVKAIFKRESIQHIYILNPLLKLRLLSFQFRNFAMLASNNNAEITFLPNNRLPKNITKGLK